MLDNNPAKITHKSCAKSTTLIVLAICALPIALPAAIALAALVFSFIATAAALILSIGITALALFLVGAVGTIAMPVFLVYLGLSFGLLTGGMSLVALGFGILALQLFIFLYKKGFALVAYCVRKFVLKRRHFHGTQ